jgi:hypothetical protein
VEVIVVDAVKPFGWLVDLDLEGEVLRHAVPVLREFASQVDACSYATLRDLLQQRLKYLQEHRPTGFVCALWRHRLLGLLPRLIAACDQRDGGLSLSGLDALDDACSRGSLEAVHKLTRDGEIRARLEQAFRYLK